MATAVIQEQQLEDEELVEEKEPEEIVDVPPQEELAAAANLIALQVNETVAAADEYVVAHAEQMEQQPVVVLDQADRGMYFSKKKFLQVVYNFFAVVIQLPTVVDLEEEKEVEEVMPVVLPVQIPLTPAQLQARAMNVVPRLGKTDNELCDIGTKY
jgi:hypothetical protein